jgi:hypothetical protein
MRTGIVDPRTIGGVAAGGAAENALNAASDYFGTPDAQTALCNMYTGPTGGFTP